MYYVDGFTILEARKNVLITAQMICTFVFAQQNIGFIQLEDSCWNFCKYSVKLCIISQNRTQKSISQEQPVTANRPSEVSSNTNAVWWGSKSITFWVFMELHSPFTLSKQAGRTVFLIKYFQILLCPSQCICNNLSLVSVYISNISYQNLFTEEIIVCISWNFMIIKK